MNLIANDDLKFLKKLLRLKTTADHPENLYKAIKMMRDHFHSFNLETAMEQIYVHNDKPSLLLSNNTSLEQDILLVGHLDIAESNDEGFEPYIENDIIYGRGSGDMKGAVISLLKIFVAVLEAKSKLKIALIFTTDEEVGGEDGLNYLLNTVGYRAKVAFVPNNGKRIDTICIEEKGVLHFKFLAEGKEAHGSRPWKGKNAIDILLNFYEQLKRFYPDVKNDSHWKKSLNLGKIIGGKAINTVPAKAEMWVDIRFTANDSKEDLIKQIESLAKSYEIETELLVSGDLVKIKEDNLYLLKLMNIMEAYLQKPVHFMKSTIASDARFFAELKIPVLSFRPDCKHIHQIDESVKISAIEDYAAIVYTFIKQWMA